MRIPLKVNDKISNPIMIGVVLVWRVQETFKSAFQVDELSKKDIVQLDEEKKASMVSNLMVVLCGDKEATPIVNTGTLY